MPNALPYVSLKNKFCAPDACDAMAETGYILQYGQPAQVVSGSGYKLLYDVAGKQLQRWTTDSAGNVSSTAFSGGYSAGDGNGNRVKFSPASNTKFAVSANLTARSGTGVNSYSEINQIGQASAGFPFYANSYYMVAKGTDYNSGTALYALQALAWLNGCTSYSGQTTAFLAQTNINGTAIANPSSVTAITAGNNISTATFGAGNTVALAHGIAVQPLAFSGGASGTATTVRGVWVLGSTQGSGVIGNSYGIDIQGPSLSTATTNIGIRVAKPTSATNNFAIQLSDTSGTADGGITWGVTTGVCNLYRSAANTLKSDTDITARHWLTNSGTPSAVAGTGAGTSPTISVVGNDSGFQVTLTTGTTPAANATIFTLTYNAAYGNTTFPVFSANNAAAASLSGTGAPFVTSIGSASFVFKSNSAALAGSTGYRWLFRITG